MKNNDVCEPAEILIFPCSGGTNVGKIANHAAIDLTALKKGKMYGLAGIGGHVDSIIESTKKAKKLVAMDGCQVQCAKKTLEHAGFGVDERPPVQAGGLHPIGAASLPPPKGGGHLSDVHVVVTELRIKKINDFMMDLDDLNKVVDSISRQIQGINHRM